MKIFLWKILIYISMMIFLALSGVFAAEHNEYLTTPPRQLDKKWRIGYIEGGPYKTYQMNFIALLEGLHELGWIETLDLPVQEDFSDTRRIWKWLAANVKSQYLEFPEDAYYSNAWNQEVQAENIALLLDRLNRGERDLDVLIAMGTWAGLGIANNSHSTPAIICDVSDAVASGVIKSVEDSGYDHIHAHVDPTRYKRQIRAFHDVIGFRKLGVMFEDSLDGRTYAALDDVENIARERDFEIITCPLPTGLPLELEERSAIECARKLAPKIDAFYVSAYTGVNPNSIPQILVVLNAYHIPTFSQEGADQVKQGVLLSVAQEQYKDLGRFYAETLAKILNGAKPRNLTQVFAPPVKIAFNKATAHIIDLRDDLYRFLSYVADEVYEDVTGGE